MNETRTKTASAYEVQYQRLLALRKDREAIWDRMRDAQKEFDKRVLAEKKKRQPKARKNFKDLPKEVMQEMLAEARKELADPIIAEKNRLYEETDQLDKKLDELAKQVEFSEGEAWTKVKSSCISTYRSQTAASTYARGSLMSLECLFLQIGIPTKVELEYDWGEAYVLYAKCEAWMADAVERLPLSIDDFIRACGRSVNPLALNPMLPQWVYDRWIKWCMDNPYGEQTIVTRRRNEL